MLDVDKELERLMEKARELGEKEEEFNKTPIQGIRASNLKEGTISALTFD